MAEGIPQPTSTPVVLLDDGELSDVRQWLSEAGVACCERMPTAGPARLLITNARRALEDDAGLPAAATHLVVYESSSAALEGLLRRRGCDLVLKRPIHPHAFRLFLAHALYSGPERRRARRVVLTAPVEIEHDATDAVAVLVSLSLRGCGLMAREAPRVGSELCVRFPPELTRGTPLRTRGPVLSVQPSAHRPGQFEISLAFRLVDPESRRTLQLMMERGAGSGAELRRRDGAPAASQPDPERRPGDRRGSPRRPFARRVPAAGAGSSHTLIGRDLSIGGMRVHPDPDLALGDVVKLAVHGQPGTPAVMLRAEVVRDEGERGLVLRFRDVPPSIAARLERIVAELPASAIEAPESARAAAGTFVSEVFGRG